MKNYRLHLIRQGITEGNLKGQYCGRRTDTPLCIEGMRELIGLREDYEYPAVGVIFCSPKTSCIQTAGIVYPKQELLTHPGLDEADLGEFDGKTINELQDNEQFVQWLAKSSSAPPPNGENPMDMLGRIAGAMDAIVRYLSREEIFDAALITHGSVISAILGSMSLPRLPAAQRMVAPGRGYTCYLSPEMWMRDRVLEVAGIVPHGADTACRIDGEVAQSLRGIGEE